MEAPCKLLLAIAREFLSDAAIDWRQEDDGSVYITSLDSNFWIIPLGDQSAIEFYTYWPFCEGARSDEGLSFVNECNLSFPMVQFSLSSCKGRLLGHYALYIPGDLERRSFIMSVRKFAETFAAASNLPNAYMLSPNLGPDGKLPILRTEPTTH